MANLVLLFVSPSGSHCTSDGELLSIMARRALILSISCIPIPPLTVLHLPFLTQHPGFLRGPHTAVHSHLQALHLPSPWPSMRSPCFTCKGNTSFLSEKSRPTSLGQLPGSCPRGGCFALNIAPALHYKNCLLVWPLSLDHTLQRQGPLAWFSVMPTTLS